MFKDEEGTIQYSWRSICSLNTNLCLVLAKVEQIISQLEVTNRQLTDYALVDVRTVTA